MWPIFTASGRVAGFGGRVLDAATKGVNVKYMNSPESIIYSKRKELFGLYQARQAIRKADLCYLVEGYTDVMAMHQQGVENVVASSGTALTPEQIHLIHRITDNITVIFDGDEAGIHASERGIDMLLAEGMNVKLLLLPDGDDPDSFARKHTATEYQQYLQDNQVDFITYKATHAISAQKGEPDAEERLIHNVAESIAVIPDEIKRTIYIRHAAQQLQMPERLITAAVNAKRGKERTPASNAPVNVEEQKREQPPQQQQQKVSPLRGDAEVSIAQMIIRYGEKVFCTIEDENGQDVPLSVAEFISYSLQDDDILLQTPIYRQILDEAVENVHNPNFRSEQYFNNHPDEEIRELAFKLGTDSVELSKLHGELPVNERLDEIIPSLIASYKLSIMQQSLQSIIEQMKSPEIKADKEKQRLLMSEFAQKSKLAKELAKACGERVVLK
jgi:DNA primase